jgi:HemK-related putative methylase
MRKLFDARPFTERLSEIDDRWWRVRVGEHTRAHVQFLARQLEPRTYELHGLRFTCPAGVYHPDELSSTRFILRELVPSASRIEGKVLDVGTGSGAIGVTLASLGKTVTATDVDAKAIACAEANALDNGVRLTIFRSDLFDGVDDGGFDVIVFNTPLLDKPIDDPVEHVACDPDGALTRRFLAEAKEHLAPEGIVVVLVSNIGHRAAILDGLASYDHYVAASDYSSSSGVFRWLVFARPKGTRSTR